MTPEIAPVNANANVNVPVSEAWMDGFVETVKSAGFDDAQIPRLLKMAQCLVACGANPEAFAAGFDKQAGWKGKLLGRGLGLAGIGYAGHRLMNADAIARDDFHKRIYKFNRQKHLMSYRNKLVADAIGTGANARTGAPALQVNYNVPRMPF